MTEAQYTHQVQIFASSSVSLREVEQDFPFSRQGNSSPKTATYLYIHGRRFE